MIKEAKLAAVLGSSLGRTDISVCLYCYADDELRQCLDRLERFWQLFDLSKAGAAASAFFARFSRFLFEIVIYCA